MTRVIRTGSSDNGEGTFESLSFLPSRPTIHLIDFTDIMLPLVHVVATPATHAVKERLRKQHSFGVGRRGRVCNSTLFA